MSVMHDCLCSKELAKHWNEWTGDFPTDLSVMMRDKLKELESIARSIIEDSLKIDGKNWEVIAQWTIALRHIEDARMRYWKVIQYSWDGVSIDDKK